MTAAIQTTPETPTATPSLRPQRVTDAERRLAQARVFLERAEADVADAARVLRLHEDRAFDAAAKQAHYPQTLIENARAKYESETHRRAIAADGVERARLALEAAEASAPSAEAIAKIDATIETAVPELARRTRELFEYYRAVDRERLAAIATLGHLGGLVSLGDCLRHWELASKNFEIVLQHPCFENANYFRQQ